MTSFMTQCLRQSTACMWHVACGMWHVAACGTAATGLSWAL